jgi:hypothetical protein
MRYIQILKLLEPVLLATALLFIYLLTRRI